MPADDGRPYVSMAQARDLKVFDPVNFYRRGGLRFDDASASTAAFGMMQDDPLDSAQNSSRDDNLMPLMFSLNCSFPYTPAGLSERWPG